MIPLDPSVLSYFSDAPTHLCEFVIDKFGACGYKYIRCPTKELLVKAMLSTKRCRCGCLSWNPQSDLEEAIYEAVLTNVRALQLVTFSNDRSENYIIKLDDSQYIALMKLAAAKYGICTVLEYVPNNSMKCKIEKCGTVKNARNIIQALLSD